MIIAHLPAGYLLTKIMSSKFDPARRTSLWVCGLIASMLPDLDIIWFHLEGGVRNHRYYLTHWPLFWLALFAVTAVIMFLSGKYLRQRRGIRPAAAPDQATGLWTSYLAYPLVMLANLMLHLLLDCLAAPLFYAAPFSWDRIHLIRVPAVYDWWVWNFLRHWTFQLELMVWATAALVFGLSAWEGKSRDRGRSLRMEF